MGAVQDVNPKAVERLGALRWPAVVSVYSRSVMAAGAVPDGHVVREDFVLGSEDCPLIAMDVGALPRLMNHGQTHACSRSSAAAPPNAGHRFVSRDGKREA